MCSQEIPREPGGTGGVCSCPQILQLSPEAGTNNAPVCAALRADLESDFQGDDPGSRKNWLPLKKEFNPKALPVL